MAVAGLFIRVNLAGGLRIGPGKIALLEAIRETGSISAAARSMGMSYRRAWLLVEELNTGLREIAVATEAGGRNGGGATLTPVGKRVIDLYREIEAQAEAAASRQFHALGVLERQHEEVA